MEGYGPAVAPWSNACYPSNSPPAAAGVPQYAAAPTLRCPPAAVQTVPVESIFVARAPVVSNMTPPRQLRDVTPTRGATPRLTPRDVTPTRAAQHSAGMTAAALAATFQGVPAPPVPAPPQPILEVLAPVAYVQPPPVALNMSGSFRSQSGSYVPPVAPAYSPSPAAAPLQPQQGSFQLQQPSVMQLPASFSFRKPQVAPMPHEHAPQATASSSYTPPPAPSVMFRPPTAMVPMVTPSNAANGVPDKEKLRLTAGLPDPASIDKQKGEYSRKIDGQLRYEEELLKLSQRKQQKLIYEAAEAQKRQACMEIEQKAKQQEHQLNQQCNAQLIGMQQEMQSWKLKLERQANEETLRYQSMKGQEELLVAQFEAKQRAWELQAAEKMAAPTPPQPQPRAPEGPQVHSGTRSTTSTASRNTNHL